MSYDSYWPWWRDKLAGKDVQTSEGCPEPGYYRWMRNTGYGTKKYGIPVAYWPGEEGELNCRIGFKDVTPQHGRDIWVSVHSHPVEEDWYRDVTEKEPPDLEWRDGLGTTAPSAEGEHGGVPIEGEEWRPFEDTGYQISSLGRVRGPRGNFLTPRQATNGYLRASLGAEREESIHRMVLTAFVGPCPDGYETDHINKDRTDNQLTNLRWITKEENLANRDHPRGEEHSHAKLTDAQVRLIKGGPFYRGRDSDIAAIFSVSRETVRDIRNGKVWAHIFLEEPETEIGGNYPPPDGSFDELRDKIQEYSRTAKLLLDGPPITEQLQADQIGNLSDRLAELWRKVEEARKGERKPHDEALKAVQLKWAPLLVLAEVYKTLKYKVLTPWQLAQKKAQEEEAKAAEAAGDQVALETRRPRAGTRGRSMTLRTFKNAEIVDFDLCLNHFKGHDDIRNVVQDLANKAVRVGLEVPGAKLIEDQRTV